jgi:hypothetical protein
VPVPPVFKGGTIFIRTQKYPAKTVAGVAGEQVVRLCQSADQGENLTQKEEERLIRGFAQQTGTNGGRWDILPTAFPETTREVNTAKRAKT